MSGLYILLPLTLPRQYGWGAARIALKVTAPSFFSALYCLTYSSSASWARLTAVSLSNPSAVPDRPTHPACAGAPRAKQKPAATNASAEPRQYDFIGTPPSPIAKIGQGKHSI